MRLDFRFHVAAALALCLVAGCASSSYGTKLDKNKVAQIQKGVTTRAEVEQMLGQPENVSLMGDGRRMMMYSYTESNAHVKGTSFIPIAGAFMGGSEGTMHHQQLQVVLNKNDVVEDYVMNDGMKNLDHSSGFGRESMTATPASSR
jgi:outer membrane protein assembly factor BamE (lipoprotein component of BamABCDE complex)